MASFLAACVCFFAVEPAVIFADDPRLNHVLTVWEKERQGIRSLAVDFVYTRKGGFPSTEMYVGTLKLLKTAQGEVIAAYALRRLPWIAARFERWDALLYKGRVYLLDHDEKTAYSLTPRQDMTRFLESYFNPFVAFLERPFLQEKYWLTISMQDEWYTYLNIEPKHQGAARMLRFGRAVLMRKSTAKLAKGLPRQLWYSEGGTEHIFDICRWRQSGVDTPKLEDFIPPEQHLGWKVEEPQEPSPEVFAKTQSASRCSIELLGHTTKYLLAGLSVHKVFCDLKDGIPLKGRPQYSRGWIMRLPNGKAVSRNSLRHGSQVLAALGKPAVPFLAVYVLEDSLALRFVAVQALEAITGIRAEFGHFDPDADNSGRVQAVKKWLYWFIMDSLPPAGDDADTIGR